MWSFGLICGHPDLFELVWTCLSAEDGSKGADEEDADDAHDEGEDGGEEEAPPFPLLMRITMINDGGYPDRGGGEDQDHHVK